MKKRTLTLIILLMCLSLVGMIGVQAYWVRQTWLAKEVQFDQQVNAALIQVVDQLEEKETATIVKQHFQLQPEKIQEEISENHKAEFVNSLPAKQTKTVLPKAEKVTNQHRLVFRMADPEKATSTVKIIRNISSDSVHFQRRFKSDLAGIPLDSFRFPTRLNTDSLLKNLRFEQVEIVNFSEAKTMDSIFRNSRIREMQHNFIFTTDSFRLNAPVRKVTKKMPLPDKKEQKKILLKKQQQAEKVMEKMVVEMVRKDVPLQKRISVSEVDSLLGITLQTKGINLPFTFRIANSKQQPLLHNQPAAITFEPAKPFYQASLFPNDLVRKPENLLVQFPDKQQFVLGSISTMLGVSTLFTLIIMGTFGATLHFIIRQKKISEIKSDFINNMTHEFKTPIATISLATDAINSPKVLSDQQRISHYTSIIKQENKRMLSQVENVLQMAILDRQELKLNLENLLVEELLQSAIDNLRLQVESRNGQINFLPGPTGLIISGDRFHLENMLANLLDNANKYSPETPRITVGFKQEKQEVIIQISDQGIGMNSEEQRHIFDKFYRVPTGNLHDVKGFGLGLSYVKNIVQLHHGRVKVSSAPGKGSTFQVILPLTKTV